MQQLIIKVYKVVKFIRFKFSTTLDKWYCCFLFYINGVKVKSFTCFGIPYINVSITGKFFIGSNFHMNNGSKYTMTGVNGKCKINVGKEAKLTIGNNVGISDATIYCTHSITIEDYAILGSGVQIRDSNGHSINPEHRKNSVIDEANNIMKPIILRESSFIGAETIILKGVTVGKNSIIGAASVITKSIPDNEIWAGNPAKFVKKLDYGEAKDLLPI